MLVLTKFSFWQGDWAPGYHCVWYRHFPDFLSRSATRRQFVYTMFMSSNLASFHLWWKKNLLQHRKVSKYYGSGCRCRHEHKCSKYIKRLSMMMLICIKQHLSNIWSLVYDNVKQHWEAELKKSVAYKKSM